MPEDKLRVLAVVGSPRRHSVTRAVVQYVAGKLAADGCAVDLLDLGGERLAAYDPDQTPHSASFKTLQARVDAAAVIVLGTPDYHGSISGTLKNFLDHFWREFAGKLFATIVASHEKGLTVTDQLRTVARQCYAWSLPYGIAFAEGQDVKDGRITSDALNKRLETFARDARVYGALLAHQRKADLTGSEPGFLEQLRKRE